MKLLVSLFVFFTLIFSSSFVSAAGGNINFSGALTSMIECYPFLNDGPSENGTIKLPTVANTSLAKTGDVAGHTPFNITILCSCKPTQCNNMPMVKAYFETGATVDPGTGYLNNTIKSTEGGAGNVQLQLLDGQSGYSVMKAGDPASGTSLYAGQTISATNSASNSYSVWISRGNKDSRFPDATYKIFLKYAVRYYATGPSSAGAVSSVVTYVLNYS